MRDTATAVNTRKSGVELLKIIGILLIIFCHSVQTAETFVNFNIATHDVSLIIMRIIRYFGTFGNLIFIISSAYFLGGVELPKRKTNKAINLLMDSSFISILIFIAFCVIGTFIHAEIHYSLIFFATNIFPDLFNAVWYIPAYFLLYMLHPYLNKIIFSINQREHFTICFTAFLLYGVSGFLFGTSPAYSRPLGFFIVYFVVSYIRRYCSDFIMNKKVNVIVFIISVTAFIVITLVKNELAFINEEFLNYPNLWELYSIVFLPMFISLFNLFLNLNITSRFINYLSSLSLFVYCIHENYLVQDTLRPKFYEVLIDKFGDEYILLFSIILFLSLTVLSFIGAAIYKATIHKLTAKWSLVAEKQYSKIVDYFFTKSKNA